MKTIPSRFALLFLVFVVLTTFSLGQQEYPQGPDSKPQAGVPKGEVLQFSFDHSKIFPGTVRDYWVYVPAEYTPDKPACLYVNQDGIQWQAPTGAGEFFFNKKKRGSPAGSLFRWGGSPPPPDAAPDPATPHHPYDH